MYKKILVPLDGSELAEKSLGEAKGLAKLTGGRIDLLRVAWVLTVPGTDPTDKEVEVVGQAQAYLDQVAQGLGAEGFEVATHVRYGHPAAEIIDAAREADLVVMSTHGRSGLDRWALGSVAEKVLRHCGRPILLVRVHCSAG